MSKIGSEPSPKPTPKAQPSKPAQKPATPAKPPAAPKDSASVAPPEGKGSVPHLDKLTSTMGSTPKTGGEHVADHMTAPPKTARGQINYGHTEAEFLQELESRGGVTKTQPTSLEGVNRQTYSLPKANPDGTPMEGGKRWPEQTKTTFGEGWNKERIGQLHDTVFDGVKPQGNTAQVKVGDEYFVGKYKPDGTPDKFYMSDAAAEGHVTEKPAATLDKFRKATGAPPADAPESKPTADAPETRPVADAPEARPVVDTPEAVKPVIDAPEVPRPGTVKPAPAAAAPSAVAAESTLAKVARVGGGVGAAGLGVVQGVHGVQELQDGKIVDGVADTGGGLLNTAGGIGLVAGSTVAAPVMLAGAAGLDAGRTIINGVQTGDAEKTTVGGVKALGAGMMGAAPFVTGSVVGAPVGLVLGLGGAAVYGAASVYENREAIGNAISDGAGAVSNWVGSWFR